MSDNFYQKVQEFHNVFHPSENSQPTKFSAKEALDRSGFKIEEIIEFLYASADNDPTVFEEQIKELKLRFNQSVSKVTQQARPVEDSLVEQVDALIDLLYFTYGSFVLMGVDPTKIFEVVHQANMGKLFPDGQPHFDPITYKVMKPDNWANDYSPEKKISELLKAQLE